MLIWKVAGESLTGGEIHVNSKWDLGLRCTVFILWEFAAFLCLWDCLLNCASSALSAQSAVFFLYPDLEQGSWVRLMMMKDTWKRQSGAKPGFRSSFSWISPVQRLPHILGEPPRLGLGIILWRAARHVTGTADSCKMNCSRTETLPECSCSFAAMIVQMVLPSFF